MPTTINKDDARRGVRDAVRDASEELVKTGSRAARNGADAGGEIVRKDMATGGDAVKNNAEAVERQLHKAAESLRGTMETSTGALGDVAGATRQVTSRAAEQFSQISALQSKVSKEASDRTLQNLQAMMQTGAKLAGGFQSVMQEWTDYTRNAMRCNIEGMTGIMNARSISDLLTAQSDLLNTEMLLMLNTSARISEATARAAKDAGQTIGERTQQRDQRKNS